MNRDRDEASPAGDDATEPTWTAAERMLLEAALDFHGAAEGVIEYNGSEPPRLRRDSAGFDAIRRAMGALARSVRSAHGEGVPPERITELTRIEPEIVALILQRGDGGDGAVPSPARG